jgi:hypothetical protein
MKSPEEKEGAFVPQPEGVGSSEKTRDFRAAVRKGVRTGLIRNSRIF